MRDVHGLWNLCASEIHRTGRLEKAQAFGLDDRGKDRETPGLETRQSDDPVLRSRRLLTERISTLGSYHRAVIVPNPGARETWGPSLPDVSSLASEDPCHV
jgi:hypothetical protein